MRLAGRQPWRVGANLAVPDHNVPTTDRSEGISDPLSKLQVDTLDGNCADFGITEFAMNDIRQGIVHIIGPEQGITLPGMTIVCGDSHTSTHGALGSLAFGIGTSEVEHALATQCLNQKKAKNMLVSVDGQTGPGVTAKDIMLAIIGEIGTAGGTGYVIEYGGDAIRDLTMEGRMTVCNMSIEAGARAGLIGPDETTFEYLAGRPRVPRDADWDAAVRRWRSLCSGEDARFDRTVTIDASALQPMVTFGTNPGMVVGVNDPVPEASDPSFRKALDYMKVTPGKPMSENPVDVVFIGSCTNSRLTDLRAAAGVLKDRQVADGIRVLVVPGSEATRRAAEAEGLDRIFLAAGAEWREPGCSMCIAMNGDIARPGDLVVSTSNRNFKGRQGRGVRTVLASPLTAAASAVTGRVTDPRRFLEPRRGAVQA